MNPVVQKRVSIDLESFSGGQFLLPPLSEIAVKIQRLTNDPHAGIGQIAELIASDPSLLAQVLKIANSAYFGLGREITDARLATASLGLGEISRMAMALSVINALSISDKKQLHRFWYHSFYTAICSKHLARRYEPLLPPEHLWSAAMLHDIGKLVYLKFLPVQYMALVQHRDAEECLFSEAEQALGMQASSEIGVLLCEHWGLPRLIKDACRIHTLQHLLDKKAWVEPSPFSRLICLSNLFAVLTVEFLSRRKKEAIMQAIKAEIGQNQDEFLLLSAEIYELRQEVERFIQGLV